MRCNHTVTYCLSQHSQEFMPPAIDLWHDAQDRGHGWFTLTSMLVKAALASLKADQDSQPSPTRWLFDVIQSPFELRLNLGMIKLRNSFGKRWK